VGDEGDPGEVRPLRVAVVGAGPAGIYTAEALTRRAPVPVTVDLLDRLPTPFGLVRHGIAPDHAKMRAIRDTLHRALDDPGVRFVGNVEVGTDITLDEAGSYRLFADFAREGKSYTLASDLRVDGNADLEPLPAPAPMSVSDGGYDVRLDAGRARPGEEADLRFAITKNGQTVHTEPYLGAGGHLVALREGDLAFLHVHPTEHGTGEKQTDRHDDSVGFAATFPTTGRYRLFLQFKHEGRVQTVAFTQEVE